MKNSWVLFSFLIAISISSFALEDTLPKLEEGDVPQNFDQLWNGYDPRAEPLDTEILHEWEEEGVVLKVIRYRVGVFHKKKAMVAAVYGYPKGGIKLPGLVNIHGGGQYADYKAVLTNAKRGYATITIAWAGRISSPHYRVSPAEVKLFWDNQKDHPQYRVTTDWGALDAYHAPSRFGGHAFNEIPAGVPWVIDSVKSPRNNSWFLCTMAARRALTFLERQPQVDGERLGVYGHSMGGKLTIQTAGSDARVKAAVPSCGGISDRYNNDPLHRATVGDSPALQKVRCPTFFINPSNDFHGHINDLPVSTHELPNKNWRVACSPHLNHQDLPEYEVATQLWFDQHLKGNFQWPTTPQVGMVWQGPNSIPAAVVVPDQSKPIVDVDFYYCQQGFVDGDGKHRENRINRFWHHAKPIQQGNRWFSPLPIFSTDRPLWVYANVTYRLESPVEAAGYYYGEYQAKEYVVSSLIQLYNSEQLKSHQPKVTLQPAPLIESFGQDWKGHWFSYNRKQWEYRTHKVYHPMWAAPKGARLSFEVQSESANTFVVGIDSFAAEVRSEGDHRWTNVTLSKDQFLNAGGAPLSSWQGIKELRLLTTEYLHDRKVKDNPVSRKVGEVWKGAEPKFRNLRWVREGESDPVDIRTMMPRESDQTAMWWRDGFPGKTEDADWRRIVQTGNYWFMLDTDRLGVARLGGAAGRPVNEVPGADLKLRIKVDGKDYHCVGSGEWSRFEGPRLIESGRFLQRGDVTGLTFKADDGSELNVEARFETAVWPDRLGMSLFARPGIKSILAGDSSFGRIEGGFGFDGTNELEIAAKDCAVPENFSVAFWAFLPKDYQAGHASPWLLCKNLHEHGDGNFGIVLRSGGIPEATLNIGGGDENKFVARADRGHGLRIEQWNHLVLSYDGTSLRLVINGENAAEKKVGRKYESKPGGLSFGNRQDKAGNGAFRFRGIVDQIRIYGSSLTEGQIAHLRANPGNGLPHLKALGEWTFRKDIPASMTKIGEKWKSASLHLSLTAKEKKLEKEWVLPAGKDWDSTTWQQTGFLMNPMEFTEAEKSSPLEVDATDKGSAQVCPVTFDSLLGWHVINLDQVKPMAPPGGTVPSNDSLERIQLRLHNPTNEEKVARLMFEKTSRGIHQKIGAPITGISAVLRDKDGEPTGIPVQLSKNWHFHPEDNSAHSGQWFHGISQLRLPPHSKSEWEITLAYGHWGGVAAASHSQLSLIGWGGNQRWDESALGSWGESICYSPEQNEADCTITDVRPLMVASMKNGEPWSWTHNVGGGDFLRFFDPSGKRLQRTGIVVNYAKQSPCLTEATYSGGIRGANIYHNQTVSLSRRNDLVCGTYQINMQVNEPVDFSRFAIFQIASDQYATTREKKLAIGDESGLMKEWPAQWGGAQYKGPPQECKGATPWVSLHETEGNGKEGEVGAWANRGFVIRSWKAKLGGKKCNPWVAEWGVDRPGDFQTSLLEIVPPPGVSRLEPGDYVKATIEHLVIPQTAEDYYGPDQKLKSALAKHGNSWRMMERHTVEGRVDVNMQRGHLQRRYPDVRVVAVQDRAEFTIQGGIAHVPITIRNLSSHKGYSLYLDGKKVDQSVHGNDFWQTDYDAKSGTWSQTYNIPTQQGKVHQIRFAK